MKKLALIMLTIVALGRSFDTQCFFFCSSIPEEPITYDLTTFKDALTKAKTEIRFSYKQNTIYMEWQGVGPMDTISWIKNLPYVTQVTSLAMTTEHSSACQPSLFYKNHLEITLKASAYNDLATWWISIHPSKQNHLQKIVDHYVFGEKTA